MRHSQMCLKDFTPIEAFKFFPALENVAWIVVRRVHSN